MKLNLESSLKMENGVPQDEDATYQLSGSFSAVEEIPSGTTGAQLLQSAVYVEAKKTGIAGALTGVTTDMVTISGFTVSETTSNSHLKEPTHSPRFP